MLEMRSVFSALCAALTLSLCAAHGLAMPMQRAALATGVSALPIEPVKRLAHMPPLTGTVRVCKNGHGWHFDPYGGRVYGFWSDCHLAVRRCAVGHGWHFNSSGEQVFGSFTTCQISAPLTAK